MNLGNWLPSAQQMSNAVQLRGDSFRQISMQQGLGLIFLIGMLAGILPFVADWWMAGSRDAVVPLAEVARSAERMAARSAALVPGATVLGPLNLPVLIEGLNTLAGLPQALPGWLAGGLSALGIWISIPLGWLQFWIVYGSLVMVSCKLLGASVTLQRFYAATSFSVVPLLLTNLSIVPFLGNLIGLVSVMWAILVYVRSVESVTGLDRLRAIVGFVAPTVFLAAAALLALASGSVLLSILAI